MLAGTGDDFPAEAVDTITVQRLETLCPKTSVQDAELMTALMDDNSVFPLVHNDADRAMIHSNLLECHMIPSLYTFIENLKYLEPCVNILRSLLPPKHKRSVRRELLGSHFRPSELWVEYAMHDTRPHPSNSEEHDRELAYQQLWLYALRNFRAMSRATPRRGASETAERRSNDPLVWQKFGALAVSLGFWTEAAEDLAAQDGEDRLAAQLVNCPELGSAAAPEATQQIASILRNVHRYSSGAPRMTFAGEAWLPPERRRGMPFDEDHEIDRPSLFLPVMYAKPDGPSEYINTLYCKWEMFRGFLGIEKVFWETTTYVLRFEADPPSHRCLLRVSAPRLPTVRTLQRLLTPVLLVQARPTSQKAARSAND